MRLAKAMTSNDTDTQGPTAEIGKLKKDLSDLIDKQDDNSWLLSHTEIEFTKELGNFL